jgi:hypothetical protein
MPWPWQPALVRHLYAAMDGSPWSPLKTANTFMESDPLLPKAAAPKQAEPAIHVTHRAAVGAKVKKALEDALAGVVRSGPGHLA